MMSNKSVNKGYGMGDTVQEMNQSEVNIINTNQPTVSVWDQLKKKNKEILYYVIDADTDSPISIGYYILSKSQLNALNEKYESMKKSKPDKVFLKGPNKWVDPTEDSPEYMKWQNDNKEIESLRWAETTIMALAEQPEGNTLQEKAKFLEDTLGGGFYDKLALEIMKSSGYDINTEIEKAKNA